MEAIMKLIVAWMHEKQMNYKDRAHPFCAENRKELEQILSVPIDISIKTLLLHYDQITINDQVQAKIEELAQPPEAFRGLLLHEIHEMVLGIQDKRKQALQAIRYKRYKERYNWAKSKIAEDYPELISFTTFTADQFKNELLKLLK